MKPLTSFQTQLLEYLDHGPATAREISGEFNAFAAAQQKAGRRGVKRHSPDNVRSALNRLVDRKLVVKSLSTPTTFYITPAGTRAIE